MMDELDVEACPLCLGNETASRFFAEPLRSYDRCSACGLVFVPRRCHLSPEAEKRRYDLHRNDPEDGGYRDFLERLIAPLAGHLQPAAEGLDFGSGPRPVMSILLAARGFRMTNYDPFYADDAPALERTYDFVTCAETVEHFRHPAESWAMLFRLVRPGGRLGVMTLLREEPAEFSRWWYRQDETHICFYSRATLEWLARHYSASVEFHGPSVALFQRC